MNTETSTMGLFEPYLSFWIGLCIAAGVGLGLVVSDAFQAGVIMDKPLIIALIAVALLIQSYGIFAVAYFRG